MLEIAVKMLELLFVTLKSLLIKIYPAGGDLILLGAALLIAAVYENYSKQFGWRRWLPIGIILFLTFSFAGGSA